MLVLPVFVFIVLFFALLIAYPWPVLATGTVLHLASLPFGYISYRNYQRQDAAARAGPVTAKPAVNPAAAAVQSPQATAPASTPSDDPDRPARLN
jgi:CDP-diacylglycerol---serine O-phosphatidyltransferase